jgi:hypothetical protein
VGISPPLLNQRPNLRRHCGDDPDHVSSGAKARIESES